MLLAEATTGTSPEVVGAWITMILAAAATGYNLIKTWRNDRLKREILKEKNSIEQQKEESEVVHRIKMDSAERERQRLETEAHKKDKQIEHYERLIRNVNAQHKEQYSSVVERLDQTETKLDKAQSDHIHCREEVAAVKELSRLQGDRIEALEKQIAELRSK